MWNVGYLEACDDACWDFGCGVAGRADFAVGVVAAARRSHCKRGHELSPENVRVVGRSRHCRACDRLRKAVGYERLGGVEYRPRVVPKPAEPVGGSMVAGRVLVGSEWLRWWRHESGVVCLEQRPWMDEDPDWVEGCPELAEALVAC